jgi:hypothetical protein
VCVEFEHVKPLDTEHVALLSSKACLSEQVAGVGPRVPEEELRLAAVAALVVIEARKVVLQLVHLALHAAADRCVRSMSEGSGDRVRE